jgi:hypothetical protein
MLLEGLSKGKFVAPYKHPKFKVLTDFTNILGNVIGAVETIIGIIDIIAAASGNNPPDIKMTGTSDIPFEMPLVANMDGTIDMSVGTDLSAPTKLFLVAAANATFLSFFGFIKVKIFAQQLMQVIKGLVPARQYALQYDSWGFYNTGAVSGRISQPITDYQYIKGQVQAFSGHTINNLYRNDYVAIQLDGHILPSSFNEKSRYNVGPYGLNVINQWRTDHWVGGAHYNNHLESYYAAYKVAQPSQYGQIDSTKQVPIACVQQVDVSLPNKYQSPIMFGGDTYINRYTEKNPFMFFNDWLINAP